MKFNTRLLTYTAIATAITCILAPLSISLPFSPVPISLCVFAIFISAYALGAKLSLVSTLLYIAIGLVGVPVFAEFSSGAGVLMGPTGGYIFGYAFVAFFTGLFIDKFENKVYMHLIGMAIGVILCYALGTIWLAKQAHMTFSQALTAGVLPFIPADAAKAAAAAIAGPKLRRALRKSKQ